MTHACFRLQRASPSATEDDWYMHSVGVAVLGNEVVCTYRRSDEHIASMAEVWCCRSMNGGRTWTDHKLVSKLGWEPDRACWIAPQLNKTKDGTLVLIIDRGEKISKFDWPMLSQWQMKPRGMSNWIMTSPDNGHTWDGPRKIDDVGGEPSYMVELSNGDWMYTRTDSAPTTAKKYPSMPWGPNYYRSTAVFSSDRGKTWGRTVELTDDPLVGDCEVGVAEYAPGKLIAISRIGDAGSVLAQPSRFVYSEDYGRTWSKPRLGPAIRSSRHVRKLRDGRLFATFRNGSSGTTGTCALAWRPDEQLPYQPQSFLWDESRSKIRDGAMELHTGEGRSRPRSSCSTRWKTTSHRWSSNSSCGFRKLLPTPATYARVRGCASCRTASKWNRPGNGVDLDAAKWHKYRLVNRGFRLALLSMARSGSTFRPKVSTRAR